jgi:hypothetical protein
MGMYFQHSVYIEAMILHVYAVQVVKELSSFVLRERKYIIYLGNSTAPCVVRNRKKFTSILDPCQIIQRY